MDQVLRIFCVLIALVVITYSSVSFARVQKDYFPDGKVYYIQVYNDQDEIVGPYRRYYPNGRLREKIWYKDGHNSLIKTWDINGHLVSTVHI